MFLFYVDESGSADLQDLERPYFTLATVGIEDRHWARVNAEIDQIKYLTFRRPGVELKSTWLRNLAAQEKRYLSPLGISAQDLSQGMDGIYGTMTAPEILYAAVVIDKREVLACRGPGRIHPASTVAHLHQIAFRFLQSVLDMFLQSKTEEAFGLLIHDMVHAREQATTGYQADFKEYYREIARPSDDQFRLLYHQKKAPYVSRFIGEMHFEDSQQSNFLQFADLAAYNVLRQFQDHGSEWSSVQDIDEMSLYSYFGLTLSNYICDKGRIKGFGLQKITNSLIPGRIAEYEADELDKDDEWDSVPDWLDSAFNHPLYWEPDVLN